MSCELLPNQLLPQVSTGSRLLQDIALRASTVSGRTEAIVVCNEEHRLLVSETLHSQELRIMVEVIQGAECMEHVTLTPICRA